MGAKLSHEDARLPDHVVLRIDREPPCLHPVVRRGEGEVGVHFA